MDAALIASGAIAGALLRWRLAGSAQPNWHRVAAINIAGSFALGALAGRFSAPDARPRVLLCLGTGFMGSLTTFSTFSLDVVLLLEQGALLRAAALAAGTPVLGVGACAAGLAVGRRALQRSL